MKRILVLFCGAVLGSGLCADVFSPGGTTFDFQQFAPKAAPSGPRKGNLLVNGDFEKPGPVFPKNGGRGSWRGGVNVHGRTPNAEKVRSLCTRQISADNPAEGKFCLRLETPVQVNDLAPKIMLSNRIVQEVLIPETKEETVWELRFKMRGKHLPSHGTPSLVILHTPLRSDPKRPARLLPFKDYQIKRYSLTPEWSDGAFTFRAPAGTKGFYVCPALYGAGTAFLDDISLTPSQAKNEVEVRAAPQGFMDNVYAVGEGLPAMINFAFASDNPPSRKDMLLELVLPPGFEALGGREFVPLRSKTKNPDGSTTVLLELKNLPPLAFTRKFFKMHSAVIVTKAPGLKAGPKRYPLHYRLLKGTWEGESHTLYLQIIPAVHARRPANFRTSAMIGMAFRFQGEMAKVAAEFYRESGFSCIYGALGDFSAELKKLGIIRYRSHYYICNGFRIGKDPRPDFAQFKLIDGKPYPRKICPVEVYREGSYFKEKVVPLIEDLIVKEDSADHIMTNWEPYYLNSKGCFCIRCRDEFIKWAKGNPSAAEITGAWPRDTLQRHGERWMLFRSWQHSRLMVTLEKVTREAGRKVGKESHFIPEIAWLHMTPQRNHWAKQYNVTDYMSELPWLEPWGPYNCWRWDTPYSYYPAPQLTMWLAAKQVRDFAKAKARPGKVPKIIGFPHGHMGDTIISQPEGIAFEMLCLFLQGWQGAFIFTFPDGYDYRYWAWAARANTAIADHEAVVTKGQEVTEQVKIVPRTPVPQHPDFAPEWSEPAPGEGTLPGLHKLGVIQHKAFRLKDDYLVAVGNFWQKGEHFFDLRLAGLGKGPWHVSVDKYDLGTYSGDELARGILLQAGALRWQFIRISPRKRSGLFPFTQKRMKELLKERLPAIRRQSAKEEALHRSRMAEEQVDLARVKQVSSAGVTVAPAGETLTVKAPGYSGVIDMKRGGRLTELQSSGTEFAGRGPNGWIAAPGVWYPRKSTFMLSSVVKVREIKAVPGGVRVQLVRLLTPKDCRDLAGAELVMRYDFLADGTIKLSSSIVNNTHDALEYAFRFHSMPAILGKSGDLTGGALFRDGLRFRRGFVVHLYHYGPRDPLMTGKEFTIAAATQAKARELTLSAPFLKGRMEVKVPENVRHLVFWDGSGQEYSTFEAVYDRTILPPGQKADYTMELKLR